MNKLMENTKMRLLAITVVSVLLLVVVAIAVASFQIGRAGGAHKGESEPSSKEILGAFLPMVEETHSTTEAPATTEALTTAAVTQSTDTLRFSSNGNGSCTLVGMGDCTDTVLAIPSTSPRGEVVTAIADRAFEGCTALTEVCLPATVRTVGSGVFTGCSALERITVVSDSISFTSIDGILFTRDKSTLICYPAARAEESYLLPTDVHTVTAYAFDGIQNLRSILYEGSTAAYQQIRIEAGNSALQQLSVTCHYKGEGNTAP